MADNGLFQINDIILDIPPQHIQISRQSFNNKWQTIRTKSSMKSKSGFSIYNIDIQAMFTDEPSVDVELGVVTNGLTKLRSLVAQFNTTPFCYVENQLLRNAILSGSITQPMALALKQIEIVKVAEIDNINAITVNMSFCWFNYFPYVPTFSFKRDLFSSEEVANPIESNAWKMFYEAELDRGNYQPVTELNNSKTILYFKQFATYTKKEYAENFIEFQALEELRELVTSMSAPNDLGDNYSQGLQEALTTILDDETWGKTLTSDIFGDTTTMYTPSSDRTVLEDILYVIDQNIAPGTNSKYNVFADAGKWRVVELSDSLPVVVKNKLDAQKTPDEPENQPASDDKILLERIRTLDFDQAGLIVTGISISFNNILATMPIIGHPFPTYQHIGSIDAQVVLSIETTGQGSIRELSDFYNIIEDQAHKYRLIPSGHRSVEVDNDLINMCGLHFFLTEALNIRNIEGAPDAYSANLVLVDNPLNPETQESISASSGFTTTNEKRLQIAKVLNEKMSLVGDPYNIGSLDFRKDTSGIISKGLGTAAAAVLPGVLSMVGTLAANFGDKLLEADVIEDGGEEGFYQYTGSTDGREAAFGALVEEYGKILSPHLRQMYILMRDIKAGRLSTNADGVENAYKTFFSLTDKDVIGIERIKADVDAGLQFVEVGEITTPDDADIRRIEETEALNNQLRELQTTSVSTESNQQEAIDELYDTILEDRDESSINLFINKQLLSLKGDIVQFLDRITTSGLINLPEFDSIRESIEQTSLEASVDCYPDFPINTLVEKLRTSTDIDTQSSYQKLLSLYDKSGLGTKGIGLTALINPDIYIYSRQNDVIDDIIPTGAIEAAVDGVVAARSQMRAAEEDWFSNVYDTKLIGTSMLEKIKQLVLNQNVDVVEEEPFKLLLPQLNTAVAAKTPFAPYDLQGACGPTIEQTKALESSRPPEEQGGLVMFKNFSIDDDKFQVHTNYGTEEAMSGPETSFECQHRFDTEGVLGKLSESEYRAPVTEFEGPPDPLADPVFSWPTPPGVRHITQPFREADVPPKFTKHSGLDIVSGTSGVSTQGSPVLAVADGTITDIAESPEENSVAGVFIQIHHNAGYASRYLHMEWTPDIEFLSDIFHGRTISSTQARDEVLAVRRGQQIGKISNTGRVRGKLGGYHLHFELYKDGSTFDPLTKLPDPESEDVTSQGPLLGIDPNNESLIIKSVQQLEKDIRKNTGYTFNRAYPTFKLYFIESDLGERKLFSYDDFFSYSSVKEIRVIRSRKIAADLCILTLTNISGVLSNRKFTSAIDPSKQFGVDGKPLEEDPYAVELSNTVKENPIASLMLQQGVEIQLSLGYSNNPNELDVVFNGKIVQVMPSDTDDLLQVVCQSHAVEMIQSIHGDAKVAEDEAFGGLLDNDGKTGLILEQVMNMPEVVHFGRWETGDIGVNSQRGLIRSRWQRVPKPQEDNIFAPQGAAGSILNLFQSTPKYIIYNTTLWDVFQEMTLRHPSYIAQAVPYEGKFGPRMTMFFGLPDQLYFARDATDEENNIISALRRAVETGFEDDATQIAVERIADADLDVTADEFQEGLNKVKGNKDSEERDLWFKRVAKQYSIDSGFMKPFRSYHVLTSTMNILHNSISQSAHNSFNTITLQYSKKTSIFDSGLDVLTNPTGGAEVSEKTGQLQFGNLQTFTLKADAAIPSEEIREMFAQYPNCVGYEMAKRYSLALLFYSLKDNYTGTVTITGNGKIRPNSTCYIFDEYTDMYGPIDVEQVIHIFSQEKGFITEITPDLCVHVNQEATLSTLDAMGLMAEHALKNIGLQSLPSVVLGSNSENAGVVSNLISHTLFANQSFSPMGQIFFGSDLHAIGAGNSGTPFGMLGTFIFRKLITRTQLAHPFRFSPLVLGGKPMIGGLPNRHTDGGFLQPIGKWIKDFGFSSPLYLNDLYDRMKINNWALRPQGDLIESLFE